VDRLIGVPIATSLGGMLVETVVGGIFVRMRVGSLVIATGTEVDTGVTGVEQAVRATRQMARINQR
jgi:hypothetical protein